jgi:hypothetical protein
VGKADRTASHRKEKIMKYMLLIYDDEKATARLTPAEVDKLIGEYWKYDDELRKAGVHVAGDALKPTDTATTVRVRNGKTLHTDGPFAETKEQLGGYYLVDVPDLDTALRWAARCPSAPMGSIEVRPLMEFER